MSITVLHRDADRGQKTRGTVTQVVKPDLERLLRLALRALLVARFGHSPEHPLKVALDGARPERSPDPGRENEPYRSIGYRRASAPEAGALRQCRTHGRIG